jgi:catechol 2,3-dioxygenase-like lactoylglutathione lyase family enzyme
MQVRGIHHVGITVPDLDAGIEFYTGVLGLELFDPPSPVFDHDELGPAVGVPDAALRQVNLSCGDSIIELIEYTSPPQISPTPVRADQRGAAHLALHVDDAGATKAELEGKGVKFLSEVNAVDEGVLAGWRWVYFRDPFGIVLELVEVAYRDSDAAAQGIDEYRRARA